MSFKPVSYMQTDSRWKNYEYSTSGENTNLGKSGCGPTAAAMAAAEWADPAETPLEAAKWSLANGYKAANQGTYYAFFTPYFKKFGLKCEQLNGASLYHKPGAAEHLAAYNAVKRGDYVIACMGKGRWTSSGHFVLWYGIRGNNVLINDPASNAAARLDADWNFFKNEVKYYFIVHKPTNLKAGKTEAYTVTDPDSFLNVRYGAGTEYELYGVSLAGTQIDVEKTENGWARIVQSGIRYYLNLAGLTKGIRFTDVSNHWAEKQIHELAALEIVHGDGSGKFAPDRPASRAEVAEMVLNAVKYIKGV